MSRSCAPRVAEDPASSLFRFALVSDAHLVGPESAALLAAAIEGINREPPDFVLFAGDMTDAGTAAQHAILRDCLRRLRAPCHLLAGNHDVERVGPARRHPETFGAPSFSRDIAGCRCLALDTTNDDPDPGNWHGFVEPPAFAWLHEVLADTPDDTPLILFTHHGLVGRCEDLTCDVGNAGEVLALLQGRRLVAGFAGHAHRIALNWWQGVPFVTAPALSTVRENTGCPPGFLWVDVLPGRVRVRLEVAGL
ncbi:MAG: metallophosphoesterase [Armatimonadetes bacterium]|nr:metallophosphoesterase [Armatimonadota bacterium]